MKLFLACKAFNLKAKFKAGDSENIINNNPVYKYLKDTYDKDNLSDKECKELKGYLDKISKGQEITIPKKDNKQSLK